MQFCYNDLSIFMIQLMTIKSLRACSPCYLIREAAKKILTPPPLSLVVTFFSDLFSFDSLLLPMLRYALNKTSNCQITAQNKENSLGAGNV